jgi:N-acetylglucosaminyldiphosphoundecaprenol N-acetyl-beta-D-mannosaminyltransferase
MRTQVNLLGTLIDCVDATEAIARVDTYVQSRRFHQVVTVNVDFLRLAGKHEGFRDLVNSSDLVLADGMPLVWASRRRPVPLPARLTGVDMILACAQLAVSRGYGIFLLGAAPGVANDAAQVLRRRFPGVRIVGTYSPPNTEPAELERCVRMVSAANADMLFVAFGAPKQEEFIRRYRERLNVPVCMGIGGSFDMLAGNVRRAPLWVQHHGLEWLYRLAQEPRRLWKRYIIHDLPVFARMMLQRGGTLDQMQAHGQPLRFEEGTAELTFSEALYGEDAAVRRSEIPVGARQSA